jgi:glycosyltransferase involved in cell wall biosynthesis
VTFRKLRLDIFLGYTVKPVVYGSIAARLAGVPRIYSIITGLGYAFSGDGVKNRLVGTIVRMLYCLSLKMNHKVFFQNPDDRTFFTKLGIVADQEQTVLINGSGVDVDFYRPMPFPEKISFLLIARLFKDKGIREYVEAARIVKCKYPDIYFKRGTAVLGKRGRR